MKKLIFSVYYSNQALTSYRFWYGMPDEFFSDLMSNDLLICEYE